MFDTREWNRNNFGLGKKDAADEEADYLYKEFNTHIHASEYTVVLLFC